ncbi:MAG: hypothetical protein ACK4L4_16545 [Gemmobacter sp.]
MTKTAGGTLKTALRETPEGMVQFIYGEDDLNRIRQLDLSSTKLVYGHTVFGVHERLKLPAKYICFLRHPVTRTISHYYHLRNVDQGPVGEKIRKSSDINDFFANFKHWEFSNFMTKIVSGLGAVPVGRDSGGLELAIKNLDTSFSFVGFQEFFPLSVRRMSKIIGIDINLKKDINIGRYSLSDVLPETLAKIEKLNEVDLALYRHCIGRYL